MAITPLQTWEERARDKQSRILNHVPQKFIHTELEFSKTDTASVMHIPDQYLSPLEKAITALKAEELVSAIAKREFTAVQVLDAFTHRAAIAHELLHCCLAFLYPTARARAEELDEYLASTGRTVGPLHGLPISVKDQCRITGTETTCGFISNLGVLDTEDCLLVQILQNAGGNVFVKTNLSVGCMWGETVNNIIGRTSNPYNRSFSCGGSSGGEGALLALHGSPMGVGTDLGGSIRSPSAYQGLWGLRPSSGRIPYYRMLNSCEGQETMPSVVGPMTLSPRSLELFTRTVVKSQPWLRDPACVPMPWREEVFQDILSGRKLRIGIMHWDEVILPQPPIRRAMKEVEKKLQEAGHEIIPWKMNYAKALDITHRVLAADANGDIDRTVALSAEPPLEMVSNSTKPPLTLLEAWSLAVERTEFQASILQQWNATSTNTNFTTSTNTTDKDSNDIPPMDAYISPVNPSICPKHGDYARVRYLAYTATLNLLDYTACTLPVTFVDDKLDLPDLPSNTHDAAGNSIPSPTCDLDAKIRGGYDPAIYKGLPVSVQIVGRRMEEEKVIAIAQVTEKLLLN